jgi:uncharacterized protein with PIN domain
VKRKHLRLASAAECIAQTGFQPGVIPAMGLPQTVEVILDTSLNAHRPILGLAAPEFLRDHSIGLLLMLELKQLNDLSGASRVADCSHVSEAPVYVSSLSTVVDSVTPALIQPSSEQKRDGSEVRFLCDAMLSKLGRWLRVLGCDVVIFEEGRDRASLVQTAALEARILLTRDRRRACHASAATKVVMMKTALTKSALSTCTTKEGPVVVLVEGRSTETQLKEVKEFLNLEFLKENFMCRCSGCNGRGFREASTQDIRAAGVAAERVQHKVTEFWACTTCNKVFWEGPKFSSAKNLLERFVS